MTRIADWITVVLGSVLIAHYVAGYDLTSSCRLNAAVTITNCFLVVRAAHQLRRGE